MKEIQTNIKGTSSISEYKQVKETLISLANEAYLNHLHDDSWIHGEPSMAQFNQLTGNLVVTYEDGKSFEYNSDMKPVRECITIAELRSIKRPVTNLYRYAGKGNNAREDYDSLTDQVEKASEMLYATPYFDLRKMWDKRAEEPAKNWRKK